MKKCFGGLQQILNRQKIQSKMIRFKGLQKFKYAGIQVDDTLAHARATLLNSVLW